MKKIITVIICLFSITLILSSCGDKKHEIKSNTGTSYEVKIKHHIDKYSQTMSSTPGIGLTGEIKPSIELSKVKYHWIAEHGTFLSWDQKSGKINNLGKEVINTGDKIYWSVDNTEKNNASKIQVILKVEEVGSKNILAENNIMILKDKEGVYYTVADSSKIHEFAIYKNQNGNQQFANIEKVRCEDYPILTEDDIKIYDWNTRQIELNDSYLQQLSEIKDKDASILGGSRLLNTKQEDGFVLVVQGKKIYSGGFPLSVVVSCLPEEVQIMDLDSNKLAIKNYTRKEGILSDPSIYKVLKNLGKLKE